MEISLEKRFKDIFFVKDDDANNAIVAAVTCPQTKLLKCNKLLQIWQETSNRQTINTHSFFSN